MQKSVLRQQCAKIKSNEKQADKSKWIKMQRKMEENVWSSHKEW